MMLQKRSYPMFSTIYMKNKLRNGNPGKKFKNYNSLETKKIKISADLLISKKRYHEDSLLFFS